MKKVLILTIFVLSFIGCEFGSSNPEDKQIKAVSPNRVSDKIGIRENIMEKIKFFLSAPDDNEDEFLESDVLIWVDWRDFDESVIDYFNEELPDEDKIQFECVETEKERGFDILLKKNGVSKAIPYADDSTDRDTTLKSIQEYISPKYQIRWYMGSLGSDTLVFCIGLTSQWEQLEQEFGAEKVAYYFAPVKADSIMFEMDIDEVSDLLEQRGEA